jgi:hypothetical protein
MAKIRIIDNYEVTKCRSEDEAKDAISTRFPDKEITNVKIMDSGFLVTTLTEVLHTPDPE